MLGPKSYTVGWIGVSTSEFVAARALFDEEHEVPKHLPRYNGNDYLLGKIGTHNVVLAILPTSDDGAVSATRVAKDMADSFPNIRVCLMVGIGGGAPTQRNDIRLGDIVVSIPDTGRLDSIRSFRALENSGVLHYDAGSSTGFMRSQLFSQPPRILLAAVNELKARYEVEGNSLQDTVIKVLDVKPELKKQYQQPDLASDRLYKSHVVHPPGSGSNCAFVCGSDTLSLVSRIPRLKRKVNPAIHYGPIASANQPMQDPLIRDSMAAKSDVLCFDTEAAGLMSFTSFFPCLFIRGICDYADSHRSKDWQGYAAMVAAAYAKELLRLIVAQDAENEDATIYTPKWGETVIRTRKVHSDTACPVGFSPDGQLLVSSSYDNVALLWDTATGTLQQTLKGHLRRVSSVAFSPDLQLLASGSEDHMILLWNIATGTIQQELGGHSDSVKSVAFSPDGQLLASGSNDHTVRLWNATTGTSEYILQHFNTVCSVAFSPDGQTLASGSIDDRARLWDTATGTLRWTLKHTHWVMCVAFSPDGQTLASGSNDDVTRLWDASTGVLKQTLRGHSHWIYSVNFSPDGQLLASSSEDHSVRIWNVNDDAVQCILEGGDSKVGSIAFSSDGRLLAAFRSQEGDLPGNFPTGTTLKLKPGKILVSVDSHPDPSVHLSIVALEKAGAGDNQKKGEVAKQMYRQLRDALFRIFWPSPLPNGITRIHWRCRCGHSSFDDYTSGHDIIVAIQKRLEEGGLKANTTTKRSSLLYEFAVAVWNDVLALCRRLSTSWLDVKTQVDLGGLPESGHIRPSQETTGRGSLDIADNRNSKPTTNLAQNESVVTSAVDTEIDNPALFLHLCLHEPGFGGFPYSPFMQHCRVRPRDGNEQPINCDQELFRRIRILHKEACKHRLGGFVKVKGLYFVKVSNSGTGGCVDSVDS